MEIEKIEWFHICFFRNRAKANTETPETKTKADIIGNRYQPNTVQTWNFADVRQIQENLNHAKKMLSIDANQQTCSLTLARCLIY
jgi:hypothetical protein